MALTRKYLKSIGLTDEQIDGIVEANEDTITGLKDRIEKAEERARAADELQKQLDALKGGKDWKAEHDKLKKEYDDYKADVGAKETARNVKAAYRQLLKDANIDEKRIDTILRASADQLKDMKLTADGKLEDADKLTEAIKQDWGDFVVTTRTRGAKVDTPPAGGKTARTREEIMAIKDTAERQKAISENMEVFTH